MSAIIWLVVCVACFCAGVVAMALLADSHERAERARRDRL